MKCANLFIKWDYSSNQDTDEVRSDSQEDQSSPVFSDAVQHENTPSGLQDHPGSTAELDVPTRDTQAPSQPIS